MKFISIRDLRNSSKAVWKELNIEGELVITNNGKPTAILLNAQNCDIEQILRDIRKARFLRLLNEAREEAARSGYMSDEEIENEIREARNEYKSTHDKPL